MDQSLQYVPFKSKKEGFISIVTPVLNGEKFIERAIRNVVSQECPAVEHLIVDGGSKDSTLKIARSYADRYSHLSVYSQENQNQSESMNLGIELSKGRILSFLNVDDYYEEGVLNKVLELFRDAPDDAFIMANCYARNEQNEITGTSVPEILDFKKLLRGSMTHPHPFNPSSYFYDSRLHEKAGFYDETVNFSMDLDFLIRASLYARSFYYPEVWGNFVMRKGAKTYELCKKNQLFYVDKSILKKYWPKLRGIERLRTQFHFEWTMNPELQRMKRKLKFWR